MDDREREHVRERMNCYRGGSHPQWRNMVSQQQHIKEQNAFFMNMKMFFSERDAAIAERDRALAEKGAAIEERDMVIRQRDKAFAERDNALRERDNAIAALHFQQDNSASVGFSYRIRVTDAVPISSISYEAVRLRQRKQKPAKVGKKKSNPSKRAGGRDRVTRDGSRAEWDARDRVGPTICFDESTMPAPVCTCTGVARQCYKWGSGGWQSSCCTTSLSAYPLPPLPPKRRGRIAGRKMRGSVFSRLLTRLSFVGHHDLSTPLDLKNYWAKHGTNRYITIK